MTYGSCKGGQADWDGAMKMIQEGCQCASGARQVRGPSSSGKKPKLTTGSKVNKSAQKLQDIEDEKISDDEKKIKKLTVQMDAWKLSASGASTQFLVNINDYQKCFKKELQRNARSIPAVLQQEIEKAFKGLKVRQDALIKDIDASKNRSCEKFFEKCNTEKVLDHAIQALKTYTSLRKKAQDCMK